MKNILHKISLLAVIVSAVCGTQANAAEFMFRASVNGETLEGMPLRWDKEHMMLLSRDGQLREFDPRLAKDGVKTGTSFEGYSADEMRAALAEEFGKRFDVSMTSHYVVVHPRGERDQWAGRFEDLYNRFGHYFRLRGFTLNEPPYPLVAVVFGDRAEYMRYAAASGTPMHPNTLGHYDPLTNRVFLFDVTTSDRSADWSANADTIIHEATHQTAYNTGVHRRFAAAPRWVVEGLATMFEASGVWSAQYDHTQSDRINRDRLADFRDYVAKRRQPGSLAALLASDDAFRTDPKAMYAEAWALSFYLSETQPRQYAEYLQRTADRPLFSEYPAGERIADFQAVFGNDLKMFETKFLRYMEDVK